jgi:hypothetical protein
LQPGSYINSIAQDIPVLSNDVAQMNANADVNLLGCVLLNVMSTEVRLNTLGTLHGINNRRKINQEPIVHSLNDVAMMVGDRLLDDLVMDGEAAQSASFIGPHLVAEAHDVGEHDRGQPARLNRPCAAGVLWHGGDYRARSLRLSNATFRCS